MNSILKGDMYITDDPNVILNIPLNQNTRIISMDEDNILPANDAILVGTCLLPPVEALMAEIDGNEMGYLDLYRNHLMQPHQHMFMAALFAFLYKGGNLIFFLPGVGYNNTYNTFMRLIWDIYGIKFGILNSNDPYLSSCNSDYPKCIPIWTKMIYETDVISTEEFLLIYPEDAFLESEIINICIEKLQPFGSSLKEQQDYILHLRKQLHNKNTMVRVPIHMIRRF